MKLTVRTCKCGAPIMLTDDHGWIHGSKDYGYFNCIGRNGQLNSDELAWRAEPETETQNG